MRISSLCLLPTACAWLFSFADCSAAMFANPTPITIADIGPNPTPASPYPSIIHVSGLAGTVSTVTVTINGLSHHFPDDIDMLLVAPNGDAFHFWSDVGGANPVTNIVITVADSGASELPDATTLLNGTTYRPFNTTANDTFPTIVSQFNEPANAGSATFTSTFGGMIAAEAMGDWKLYITDDLDGDAGSISGGWSINVGLTGSPTTSGQLIISEFRLRGPNGADDEFIELYNTTDSPLVTQASDASAGLAIAASDGVIRVVVPNGTIIPPHGHLLCANAGSPDPDARYSLGVYPGGNNTTTTPDITFTNGISDNSGIALFNNSSGGASFSMANRLDAVGSDAELDSLYRAATGYPALPITSVEFSVHRRCNPLTGLPVDTGNNANDFAVVAVDANASLPNASLGAPGPENSTSPAVLGSLAISPVSPCVAADVPPNLVRTGTNNAGTLSIRRRFTNTSGSDITRLRFRILELSNSPAPNESTAVLSTVDTLVSTELQPCVEGTSVTFGALTLEEPPDQWLGGGNNSSLWPEDVTPATPLPAGGSIDVSFQFNISQIGFFHVAIAAEGLPSGGGFFEVEGEIELQSASLGVALNIARAANDALITWPANAQGYTLQSATNLSANSVWTAVPDLPSLVSNRYVLTNALTPPRFYRLMK